MRDDGDTNCNASKETEVKVPSSQPSLLYIGIFVFVVVN